MATVKNLVTGEFSEAVRLLPGDSGYQVDAKDEKGNDLPNKTYALKTETEDGIEYVPVSDAEFGRTWTGYTLGDKKELKATPRG